jgi:hypothetical protein
MSCPHKHQQQVFQTQKALHPFFGIFSEVVLQDNKEREIHNYKSIK